MNPTAQQGDNRTLRILTSLLIHATYSDRASAEATFELVVNSNVIVRNVLSRAGHGIPNVKRMHPGDAVYLVYRDD